MSIEKKLTEWHSHQLIDETTLAKLRAYEASRPQLSDRVWRYGLIGLAALCVGLGLLFIIAANWQDIPFAAKLGASAFLNIALAGWITHSLTQPHLTTTQRSLLDIPLCLLAAGQLGMMALIGQYLHSSAPIEDVMLYWWVLCAPMLVLAGYGKMSGLLFVFLSLFVLHTKVDLNFAQAYAPLLVLSLALFIGGHLRALCAIRPAWAKLFRQTGMMIFLGLGFIYLILSPHLGSAGGDNPATLINMTAMIASGGILLTLYRFPLLKELPENETQRFTLLALSYTAVSIPVLGYLPLDVVSFCVYFLGLGWLAWRHAKHKIVTLAILCLAGRLIVYFIATSNNMLMSGIIMMIIGLLTVLLLRRLFWITHQEDAA